MQLQRRSASADLAVLLVLLVALVSAVAVEARVIAVSTTGSDSKGSGTRQHPYRTIGFAVRQAHTDDFVRVDAGNYDNERIVLSGKNVTVYSAAGATKTSIRCTTHKPASNPPVSFGGTTTSSLVGFTVESCQASRCGGAMRCTGGTPTVSNCAFKFNTANQGGALCIHRCSMLLHDVVFAENTATAGGAMYLSGMGSRDQPHAPSEPDAPVSREGVGENEWSDPDLSAEVSAVLAELEEARSSASQVYAAAAEFDQQTPQDAWAEPAELAATRPSTMIRSVLAYNEADIGGAIVMELSSALVMNHTQFTENEAKRDGGALALASSSNITSYDLSMTGNSAARGAVASLSQSATLNMTWSVAFGNNATVTAGGVYCSGSHFKMEHVSWLNNTSHDSSILNCDSRHPCFMSGYSNVMVPSVCWSPTSPPDNFGALITVLTLVGVVVTTAFAIGGIGMFRLFQYRGSYQEWTQFTSYLDDDEDPFAFLDDHEYLD